MSAERRIVFEDVSKFYGEVLGVNRVTLSLPPGITSLVGPNGSGKTTLMLGAAQGCHRLGSRVSAHWNWRWSRKRCEASCTAISLRRSPSRHQMRSAGWISGR